MVQSSSFCILLILGFFFLSLGLKIYSFFEKIGSIFAFFGFDLCNGARHPIIYRGVVAEALISHSALEGSECEPGVVGTCSSLAALRGVSEDWGFLVVIYSLSKVELERVKVSSVGRNPYLGLPRLSLGGNEF